MASAGEGRQAGGGREAAGSGRSGRASGVGIVAAMGRASDEIHIAPSLLSADFGNLAEAVGEVAGATHWLHIDVMDGHFVPNLTIGPPVVASLRRHSEAFFDCHLMMTNPGEYFEAFREAGASSVTVHAEIGGTGELLAGARQHGLGVGLALNPDTPFSAAEPHLGDIDLLLLMTVFPGFGGQKFMAGVLPKVAAARAAIDAAGLDVPIEVDGGIALPTVASVAQAGARVLVAGSAVFGHEQPWKAVEELKAAAEAAIAPRAGGGGSAPPG
ncbi:MAG TPA: ribulose-phosphate 3-epimerase [Acidimicrobiales bacterium]|nr:ribulose-phosphate 3-epimerase [Acidimicrobiales bacterium]